MQFKLSLRVVWYLIFLLTFIMAIAVQSATAGVEDLTDGIPLESTSGIIAVDNVSNIYVADIDTENIGYYVIKVLAPNGQVENTVRGLKNPGGITCSSLGIIYVADTGDKNIKIVGSSSGGCDIVARSFVNPVAVAADTNDNLYVADGNSIIKVTNNVKTTLGSSFNGPMGVAVNSSGDVYVADTGNGVIKKIDTGGNVTLIGPAFNSPHGISADADGYIYVADQSFVKKMNKDGIVLRTWQCCDQPGAIAVDNSGNIYVIPSSDKAIIKIMPGAYSASVSAAYYQPLAGDHNTITLTVKNNQGATDTGFSGSHNVTVSGCTAGPNGSYGSFNGTSLTGSPDTINVNFTSGVATADMILVNASEQTINFSIADISKPVANSLTITPQAAPVVATVASGFNSPFGIAVDSSGNIYIADSGDHAVKMIDAVSHGVSTVRSDFKQPVGVAVDNNGNIYIADQDANCITKMDASGNNIASLAQGMWDPIAVAVSGDGRYVCTINGSTRGLIREDTIAGTGAGLGAFVNPMGLAVDNSGIIYLSETDANRVIKYTPAGSNTTAGSQTTVMEGVNRPIGITLDSNGSIIVAVSGENAIRVKDTNNRTTVLGYGLNNPCGVAVDRNHNIYVADAGSQSVKVMYYDWWTASAAAGLGNTVTLTVKDSLGNTDTSFIGKHNVTISGYNAGTDGSYGSFDGIPLTAPPNTVSVNFTSGIANPSLIFTSTTEQPIKFSIAGISTPTTNNITINPSGFTDECFIATAAFGSKLQPCVVLLRQFRDKYLLTNSLGQAFVRFYYHNSPPIAAYIADHTPLKALVRVLLLPLIAVAYAVMHPAVGLGFLVIILAMLLRKYRVNSLTDDISSH